MEEEIFEIEFCKHFVEIKLPESHAEAKFKYKFIFNKNKNTQYLKYLNRVNLFVGENNSGKSLLLRELYKESQELFLQKLKINEEYFKNKFKLLEEDFELNSKTFTKYNQIHLTEINRLIKSIYEIKSSDQLKLKLNLQNVLNTYYNYIVSNNLEYEEKYFKKDDYKEKGIITFPENVKINKLFIYNFRSLGQETFNSNNLTWYIKQYYNFNFQIGERKTIIPQNENEFINYHFENGSSYYDVLKTKLLTNHYNRKIYTQYEEFLKNEVFFKDVSITPNDTDNLLINIKIGNDEEKPIYELGTGLQMMIMLTWPLFNYDSGILFVEEPETYLHPKFQNLLINLYANHPRSKHFQFFITTHSNHIIDSIGNEDKISTYTVEKLTDDEFYVQHLDYGDTKPYELLGVKPSSLSFANGIIWVEGPSDMIYLKKWIELVNDDLYKDKKDKLIKGKHYEILIYGGKNLSHFDFFSDYNDELTAPEKEEQKLELNKFIKILKINFNFIFLADSDISNITDNESKGYNQKYNMIASNFEENNLKEKFFFTSGRTIENYITKDMLSILTKEDIVNEIDRFTPFFDNLKNYEIPPYYESLKGKKNLTKRKSLFANRISNITNVAHIRNSPNWDTDINSENNLYSQIKRMIIQIRKWNHLT